MSYECDECGESFDTLSGFRLHDCTSWSDDTTHGDGPPADEWDSDAPPVEEEYATLVGDLPGLVSDATEGDVPSLYRAIAEYETVLENAPGSDEPGAADAYYDILFEYYEPLADGLDVAARANGWDVLVEFVDAYDPREGDRLPEVSHVIANAVGRSLVRTRLSEGVESVPPDALAYLGAIPEHVDEHSVPYEESYTYGWGIGHPDHSVSDRLRALADTEHKWVSITLNTAFYADQHAAVGALERLVTDEDLTGAVRGMSLDVDFRRYCFRAAADLKLDVFGPHVPPYWDWEEELDFSFELEPEVERRIRDLARDVGIVDDLPDDWTLEDLDPGPLTDLQRELKRSSDGEP